MSEIDYEGLKNRYTGVIPMLDAGFNAKEILNDFIEAGELPGLLFIDDTLIEDHGEGYIVPVPDYIGYYDDEMIPFSHARGVVEYDLEFGKYIPEESTLSEYAPRAGGSVFRLYAWKGINDWRGGWRKYFIYCAIIPSYTHLDGWALGWDSTLVGALSMLSANDCVRQNSVLANAA